MRAGTLEEGLANGRNLLDSHPELALQQAEVLLKLGPDARVLRLAAAAHRKLGDKKKAQAPSTSPFAAANPPGNPSQKGVSKKRR